jgi:hypothetical protein
MPPRNPIMSAFRRRSIEANLFPAALPAVEPWERFRWHGASGESCDTYKEKSSQALAIDVFGTLQQSADRDAVFDHLAGSLGLPAGGPWEIMLEWRDPHNLLKEKQRTWVDAVARSPRCLIFFECKFCEPDGGGCGQTHPILTGRRKGLRQCNGSYTRQHATADDPGERCILTTKGMRYWEIIPEVFDLDPDRSYLPCPFAGPRFQWMRNLTSCFAVAREAGLQPAFLVVYADAPPLPMAQRVRLPEWQRLTDSVNPQAITFRAMSFQALVAQARQAAPANPVLPELAFWVQRKIDSVIGMPHVSGAA